MKPLYYLAAIMFSLTAHSQCKTPVITNTTTPPLLCSGSTTQLTATADAYEVLWYTGAEGSTPIASGSTFTTAAIPVTTSFWAEARNRISCSAANGGKVSPAGNSSAKVAKEKDAAGLQFNANEDFILNSVDVYVMSTEGGTITIQLRDGNNKILETAHTQSPTGSKDIPIKFTVPLNFNISKGSNYKLVVAEAPEIAKDHKSGNYPYALDNVASITAGVISKGNDIKAYYYLYNWNYSPYSYCASERKEVIVNVNPAPPVAKAHDICFSGTVADLKAEGSNIKWYDAATGSNSLPAITPLKTQTYYVSQTTTCESARVPISVIVHSPQPPKAYPQLVCSDVKVSDLQAEGINLKWYQEETGGEAFADTTQVYNITYYVSQSIGSCESGRFPVDVTLKREVPAPFVNNTGQEILLGMKLADLAGVVGENLQLYDKTTHVKLDNNTILQRGEYTVRQTVDGCESGAAFILYMNPVTELDKTFQDLKYNEVVNDRLLVTNGQPIGFAKVYNIYQDVLARQNANAGSIELDVSSLSPGTYYAEIFSNTKSQFIRFVKD